MKKKKPEKVIWAIIHDFNKCPNDYRYYSTKKEASENVRRLIKLGWKSFKICKYLIGQD